MPDTPSRNDLRAQANTASRSDLSPLVRRITSYVSRVMMSETRQRLAGATHEGLRRVRGAGHCVHYFHEVDDPYSHLAAQALAPLAQRYALNIVPHLARRTEGLNLPEPELLARLAHRDAQSVAPHYGLSFPEPLLAPDAAAVRLGQRILSRAARDGSLDDFAERAVRVGEALFAADERATEDLGAALPPDTESDTDAALTSGTALRDRLGHYSGATFYYAGEWYWGVDRLHHLEARLARLGAARNASGPRFARPAIAYADVPRADELTLEVFPSLRSPYTAIVFETTLELARRTGVRLITRPVLPMVMRGVPVTFTKGRYIMMDSRREAATLGVRFGRMYDPIGEPVRRAYSLWPWARDQGRGDAFLSAFLRAAFADGVDTSRDAGLRRVAESAGLIWRDALPHIGETAWQDELEANRLAMVGEMGQWGVPSFRLRGPLGEPALCVWGQDRLWLVAAEIQRRGHIAA